MRSMQDNADLVEMTANIVSAYVRNNVVAFSDLPALIETVFQALAGIDVNTSTDPVWLPNQRSRYSNP